MWAEKRPHEWLEGVLGVLGLASSAHISQINQKVIKGYNTIDSKLMRFVNNSISNVNFTCF
jgi:hypothetical protein